MGAEGLMTKKTTYTQEFKKTATKLAEIQKIHASSRGNYGSPRILKKLRMVNAITHDS